MKFIHWLAAGGLLPVLCACAVAPSPTQPSALATVDARTPIGFEPEFYRAFLQNAFESPARLEPVRILRAPLRLYIQTHDNHGRSVDAATLAATEQTLINAAPIWSGGTFGVVAIVRGAATREDVPGWLTVKWSADDPGGSCGRSTVGRDGGFIELNVSGACSCGRDGGVFPRLVRHELGHAMGYYHTNHPDDVMYGQSITTAQCDAMPSERERHHAKVAHSELK